ncbi:unnamed protein product [Auanema sp. JU1783]|nr:unnamed protein product [Auanema sp. JU1783]
MVLSSVKFYVGLGLILFISTFDFIGLLIVIISTIFFLSGFSYVLYYRGQQKYSELKDDFASLTDFRYPNGISLLLQNKNRFNDKSGYDQVHSMTGSAAMDSELEQILNLVLRDYIDSWYKQFSTDELFKESLKRTTRRSISALSQSVKRVDWNTFFTRHLIDDFASHLRLYRMATEKAEKNKEKSQSDLLSYFFDFELEMEKSICRDLVSTTPHYENAYLHDLVDIILYLVMPPEDFRCRPLRFLLREIIVRQIIMPLLNKFSDPAEMTKLIVWLFSEVNPRPEDFVLCLENSTSMEELQAVYNCVLNEELVLRGKDSGGEQGDFVKQQLGSLEHVKFLINKKMSNFTLEQGVDVVGTLEPEKQLIKLPLHVVLTNNVAVSYFFDFLQTVGGQNYIDCYLAIEGFKVSVEHQLRSLSNGESGEDDVYETIKEAAQSMYHQYLSQEAITRVPLDESSINKFLTRLRHADLMDTWFENIQDKIVEVLRNDEQFYPAFQQNPLYSKMLIELGIMRDQERSETPLSELSVCSDEPVPKSPVKEEKMDFTTPPSITTKAVVETLGIGHGKQPFAVYNVRVSKEENGKNTCSWNVQRRYSDFHMLHSFIVQKYPKLSSLSFPGKKTFNNLDPHFLEKRTKALNQFLESILQPSLIQSFPELDRVIHDFLCQRDYTGSKESIGRKMMSVFDPIKNGVKAVGNTVMAVPEQMFDGVSKSINIAKRTMIPTVIPKTPVIVPGRVAAAISDQDDSENIPLRVLILFVDEVFGVRGRNAWFRRQMVTMLRQIVTPFGTTLNKKIISMVNWLTSEQQVTLYIVALREILWPDGHSAPPSAPICPSFACRSKVLAKSLMLSALPDELRIILGADTTYQGINTITEALQNKDLNRRLLYVIFERLLIAIFPDNRFERIFAQLHSKSPRSQRP